MFSPCYQAFGKVVIPGQILGNHVTSVEPCPRRSQKRYTRIVRPALFNRNHACSALSKSHSEVQEVTEPIYNHPPMYFRTRSSLPFKRRIRTILHNKTSTSIHYRFARLAFCTLPSNNAPQSAYYHSKQSSVPFRSFVRTSSVRSFFQPLFSGNSP